MSSERSESKGIPWLRIGAESAAIVLSILLAFTIDASWDYRQDRMEEREILLGLEDEYDRFVGSLGRRAGFYDSVVVRLEWLLDASAADANASARRFDQALGTLVGAPTFEFASNVRDGLMASGRLSIIRSEELRSRLSGWDRVRGEVMDNEAVVREYVGAVLVPFLAERDVPIGRSFATWRDAWGLTHPPDADAVATYRSLVADPRFRILATWRYDWALGSAGDSRDALFEAQAILALIREGLQG